MVEFRSWRVRKLVDFVFRGEESVVEVGGRKKKVVLKKKKVVAKKGGGREIVGEEVAEAEEYDTNDNDKS